MIWFWCRSALVARASYRPRLRVLPWVEDAPRSVPLGPFVPVSRPSRGLRSPGSPAACRFVVPDVPLVPRKRR